MWFITRLDQNHWSPSSQCWMKRHFMNVWVNDEPKGRSITFFHFCRGNAVTNLAHFQRARSGPWVIADIRTLVCAAEGRNIFRYILYFCLFAQVPGQIVDLHIVVSSYFTIEGERNAEQTNQARTFFCSCLLRWPQAMRCSRVFFPFHISALAISLCLCRRGSYFTSLPIV